MVDSDGTGGDEASPAKGVPIPGFVSRILLWLWAHGFRFLGLLDAITLYALMVLISFVRFGFSFDWDTYPLTHYFGGFAIATGIHLVVNYFGGPRVAAPARRARRSS